MLIKITINSAYRGVANITNLIEIIHETAYGYHPVVRGESWRVAVLNWHQELLPENISEFQKHDETDEVFVLLNGRCVLYLLEEPEDEVIGIVMEPHKIYKIKRGVYHSHTLTREAMVLIVENDNTSDANSPCLPLTERHKKQIRAIAKNTRG